MLSNARSRAVFLLSRRAQVSRRRGIAVSANRQQETKPSQDVSKTGEIPAADGHGGAIQEGAVAAGSVTISQAPNRLGIWSRSQNPRTKAMTGPRFEQTTFELQPQPEAAIELIHKQPVRWTKDRFVSCDGGGGPLGHPRIFINVDKPQICPCEYCGLPYANEQHRKHLESLPSTPYPLEASGNANAAL